MFFSAKIIIKELSVTDTELNGIGHKIALFFICFFRKA